MHSSKHFFFPGPLIIQLFSCTMVVHKSTGKAYLTLTEIKFPCLFLNRSSIFSRENQALWPVVAPTSLSESFPEKFSHSTTTQYVQTMGSTQSHEEPQEHCHRFCLSHDSIHNFPLRKRRPFLSYSAPVLTAACMSSKSTALLAQEIL